MPTPYTNAINTHIQLAGEADALVTLLAAKMAQIATSEALIINTISAAATVGGNYANTPAFPLAGQHRLDLVAISNLERMRGGGQATPLAELTTQGWGSFL